jgi:hypothetical protein
MKNMKLINRSDIRLSLLAAVATTVAFSDFCLGLLGAFATTVAVTQSARADTSSSVVAIASRASADYVRPKYADGSYKQETFAFGKGGVWGGALADPTIDKLDFMDVARTIAGPLANKNYLPSNDPKTTRLLIMVYWGITNAPEHANGSAAMQNLQNAALNLSTANGGTDSVRFDRNTAGWAKPETYSSTSTTKIMTQAQEEADNALTGAMASVAAEDRARDRLDAQNASMLGYDGVWNATSDVKGTAIEIRRQDLVNELEEGRYFVVLMAYDFQNMWREKKAKLLWETRFSIRERGNDFGKELAAMTQDASRYFGQDSQGLVRKPLPEGHVEIGEGKVLAYEHANSP